MRKRRSQWSRILYTLLGTAILHGMTAGPARAEFTVGDKLADFTLRSPDGDSVTVKRVGDALHVTRDGKIATPKVLAIHLLQPDCLQCRAQLVALGPLHERFASQGLLILGISHRGDRDDLAALRSELDIPFPLLLGTGSDVAAKFASGDTFALIDAEGVVRFAQVGYGDGDEDIWEKNIERMLAGRPPAREGIGRKRLIAGDSHPAVVLPSLRSGKPMSLMEKDGKLLFRDDAGKESRPKGVVFFFSRY